MTLENIRLQGNNINEIMSEDFGAYPDLQCIDLTRNNFYGAISANWGQSLNLTTVRFSKLSGTIPKELGKLKKLAVLGLSSHHLRGGIPMELGDLTKLGSLNISGNELTGFVRKELGKPSSMEIIFSRINLVGKFPKS